MDAYSVFKSKAPKYMAMLMTDFGFSATDAAAVMGNAGHESKGLTDLTEDAPLVKGSKGGYGWFQWTGPRRDAFEDYCTRNSLKSSSDDANYKFLFTELKGDEAGAVKKTKSARSLATKTKAFCDSYERPAVKAYTSRTQWAQKALDAYQAVHDAKDSSTVSDAVDKLSDVAKAPSVVKTGSTAVKSAAAAAAPVSTVAWYYSFQWLHVAELAAVAAAVFFALMIVRKK